MQAPGLTPVKNRAKNPPLGGRTAGRGGCCRIEGGSEGRQEMTKRSSQKMTRTALLVYPFPRYVLYAGVHTEQETGKWLSQPCSIGSRKNLSLASVKLDLLIRN